MDFSNKSPLSPFFYGCVYFLMGHNEIAKSFLSSNQSIAFENSVGQLLLQHINQLTEYDMKKTIKDRFDKNIISPNLLTEINDKLNNYITKKKYYDDNKYSRNWFQSNKHHITESEVNERIGVIILYILRSYCSLHKGRRIIGGTLGAFQKGLNDISQADSLWEDLYFHSRCHKIDKYIKFECGDFILNIFDDNYLTFDALIAILRFIIFFIKANIYKEIHFSENAIDNYFSGLRLYDSIITINNPFEDKYDNKLLFNIFLCPVIAKSYFEVSKLLFDKGLIVQSLIKQLESIQYVYKISYFYDPHRCQKNGEFDKQYNNISKAINLLNRIKDFFIKSIRKDMLLSLFVSHEILNNSQKLIKRGFKNISSTFLCENIPLISPENINHLKDYIPEYMQPLIADALARIGFTLFTVGLRIYADKLSIDQKAMINNADIIKRNNDLLIKIKNYCTGFGGFQSEVGNYTMALIGEDIDFFSNRIERVFSNSAIKSLKTPSFEQIEDNLCAKLTRFSLSNVGNITSIPLRIDHFLAQDGYEERTNLFDRPTINKFVVLRRWQSFNPKVPRPRGQDIRGGGYFLVWNKKGIVIDPGYDFIKNFYEEGFSIDDINAIIVTHTHPDHEDELNTIITLLAEWNQYQQKKNYIRNDKEKKDLKYIDLFLNEGAYRKYNNWLYGKDIMIRKIYLLQASLWDKTSVNSHAMNDINANRNPIIDLKRNYNLDIEIIPAWHNQLIDKHSSVGFILHLYHNSKDKKTAIKIGYTGDTEAYDNIEKQYSHVDILIAHLGDIKLRELLSRLDVKHTIMNNFIETWFTFCKERPENLNTKFIDYLLHQDLYGVEKQYLEEGMNKVSIEKQFKRLQNLDCNYRDITVEFNKYYLPKKGYKYKNHLGILGLFKLYKKLISYDKYNNDDDRKDTKLMIIGELPEELHSYRHLIARVMQEFTQKGWHKGRCFTGDIGLTVGLPTELSNNKIYFGRHDNKEPSPKFAIRCLKCFQNNEYIKGISTSNKDAVYLPHYHSIDSIQETCLKAVGSRIIWLCHNFHARTPDFASQEFFIAPDLRAVWG